MPAGLEAGHDPVVGRYHVGRRPEATDIELSKITAAVGAGRLTGAGEIGIRVGKVVGRYKMAKHYTLTITEDTFSYRQGRGDLQELGRVERDFRSMKAIDLDLRPIHHSTQPRVQAHVFICMLAAYLVWHLRQAWAPLTFTDEQRPAPSHPPDAPKAPTPKPRPKPPPTTYPPAASPPCSTTSPP
jgi:hypothetical protein